MVEFTNEPSAFRFGRLLIFYSVSLIDTGLFRLSNSFCVSFGSLCLWRDWSISSGLSDCGQELFTVFVYYAFNFHEPCSNTSLSFLIWLIARNQLLPSLWFSFWFFFVCLFFNGCMCGIWKLLGQGFNLSHSCELDHSCGNARSFNPLHQAGNQTWTFAVTQATEVGFLTHGATAGTPDFYSDSYYLFSSATLDLICFFFFPSFLSWKLNFLILDLSFF